MPKYASLMKEIKLRVQVVDHLASGGGNALFVPTTVECIYLQLRKVLELVAFGSLVANRVLYSKVHRNFAKHWNARLLVKDLHRVNPNYYPRAIREVTPEDPAQPVQFVDREDGLSESEFVELYERCGRVLHADNPFGSKVDWEQYRQEITHWRQKLLNLLNSHTIRLVDEARFHLVHMKEPADEEVHWYEFQRVDA
ncbi:MAG TPA: hypothetical protein VKV22_03950 [Rhodanobacteraceae bacterium]|nr:hypothetical protein [Rhodanobacteraceae bacterium]